MHVASLRRLLLTAIARSEFWGRTFFFFINDIGSIKFNSIKHIGGGDFRIYINGNKST